MLSLRACRAGTISFLRSGLHAISAEPRSGSQIGREWAQASLFLLQPEPAPTSEMLEAEVPVMANAQLLQLRL
jgi:hypothetical protein